MIRATTGGVMRNYRRNLMNSFISKSNAMNTVLTNRNFNSYAEDPAAAAKAFRLRKSRIMTATQMDICNGAYKKHQSAFSCLQSIDELIDTENKGNQLNTLKATTQEMLNDPTGDARTQLTKALDQLSETIVQTLNQKYGENFIFAGADGHNVPFEVKDNKLYYRGVPVDAAEPELFDADGNGAQVRVDANGNVTTAATGSLLLAKGVETISKADYDAAVANQAADPTAEVPEVLMDGTNATQPYLFTDKDGNQYYIKKAGVSSMTQEEYDTAMEDAAKLKTLVNEKRFIDIGLGFQENENSELIESSGYNDAIHGITFIGYGVDEDGDPKNIYSIVQKLKNIAENVPEEGQWSTPVYEEFRGLVLKLEKASSDFKTEFTNMNASTTKLENNYELLKENRYNLTQQYSDLEDVNMAEAISAFIWAQYSYNAALKVGNSILSESLMDYLN